MIFFLLFYDFFVIGREEAGERAACGAGSSPVACSPAFLWPLSRQPLIGRLCARPLSLQSLKAVDIPCCQILPFFPAPQGLTNNSLAGEEGASNEQAARLRACAREGGEAAELLLQFAKRRLREDFSVVLVKARRVGGSRCVVPCACRIPAPGAAAL